MSKSINLKKISYSFDEKLILRDVSLKCTTEDRLCILGENGAGKSTLLKIISGTYEAESGILEKNGHIRIIYIPQEFDYESLDITVAKYVEKIAGLTLGKKASQIASELGFNIDSHASKLCRSLSGGQQKILALSAGFATNPDFILLDEPENHIDIVSRVILIRMLDEYKGGIIFISHDRLIIDAIATKVAEVAGGEIHISEGGYDDYIETKMSRIGGLQRQFDAETKRIKQLETTVVILHQKAIRGKEISAYRRKKEELEGLKKLHKESPRPDDKKTKIRIQQNENGLHGGKLLCRVKDVSFRYKGAKSDMFRDVSMEVRTGSHIVLLGRNGSGKSTFLKCLTGDLPLDKSDPKGQGAGLVEWADNITRAYFDQHAEFDPEARPLHIVMKKLNCFEEEARAVLGAMRFNTEKMMLTTKDLSGGERMRLRFAIVFGLKPDFLILDEPTNHLDEVTWEILLQACNTSKSTILLVSHDYEFIEAFNPGVFWVMGNQSVTARYKELSFLLEEMGA